MKRLVLGTMSRSRNGGFCRRRDFDSTDEDSILELAGLIGETGSSRSD